VVQKSDNDLSIHKHYDQLETEGFSLRAIKVDGPLGTMLEKYNA
jgi:hypothetical protein